MIEVLAPAGSQEALLAAVQNGADAVYLAGTSFGARAYADNFDNEAMVQAISYCHSYGVKVYLTMNTILFSEEIDTAFHQAVWYYQQGVDAILVQDLGLFWLLRNRLPQLPLHASTQMHIHNIAGVRFMKKQGAARIVAARETPLSVLVGMAKQGIEIEAFVHGALCVCYSGQCLMSSINQGRSGNRGMCAQPCRFRYVLWKDGKPMPLHDSYLLSPKDLYSLPHIPELVQSGICSFKIEGRMKRPEYVAAVVRAYREAVDAAILGAPYEGDEESLQKVFHRGFTEGHMYHKRALDLMNPTRPNHIGIPLGTVTKAGKRRISIRLSHPLHQHDGIRILQQPEDVGLVVNRMYQNGKLINQARPNEVIELEVPAYVKSGSTVVLTSDSRQLQDLQKTYQRPHRHLSCALTISAHIGKPLKLIMSGSGKQVEAVSDIDVQRATRHPISRAQLVEQCQKTQDTPYQFESIQVDMDENIFLPIKTINETRRRLVDAFRSEMIRLPHPAELLDAAYPSMQGEPVFTLTAVAHTCEQYEVLRHYPVQCFTDNQTVYEKAGDPQLGFVLPRVNEADQATVAQTVYVQEMGQLDQPYSQKYASEAFHAANPYAVAFLYEQGCTRIGISQELSDSALESWLHDASSVLFDPSCLEKTIYAHRELMVSKYCAPNTYDSTTHQPNCGLCRSHTYALDDGKRHYPLLFDRGCHMHILEPIAYDVTDRLAWYRSLGICHFKLVFTIESATETQAVMERLLAEL